MCTLEAETGASFGVKNGECDWHGEFTERVTGVWFLVHFELGSFGQKIGASIAWPPVSIWKMDLNPEKCLEPVRAGNGDDARNGQRAFQLLFGGIRTDRCNQGDERGANGNDAARSLGTGRH